MSLFHYTSEDGLRGILAEMAIRPSLLNVKPQDARYGDGQYFTDLKPGEKNPGQLSRLFLLLPFAHWRFTHHVEIDLTDLEVKQCRAHVFLVENRMALPIEGRLRGFGLNPGPKGAPHAVP